MSWHANFPAPKATPPQMTVQELADLQGTPGVDYIVVDARRTDIVGDEGASHAVIPGAVNLPAQTFYPTLPVSAQLLKRVPTVVFHCNSCSPGGRGPRSAGWYQDWVEANGAESKAYVLAGGWKAWVAAYPDKVVKV